MTIVVLEVVAGEKRITLTPADNFSVDLMINYDHPMISCQSSYFDGGPFAFKTEISRARTFGIADEVAALHAAGFALGGSLENAVVCGMKTSLRAIRCWIASVIFTSLVPRS